jgi:hypothetical protein
VEGGNREMGFPRTKSVGSSVVWREETGKMGFPRTNSVGISVVWREETGKMGFPRTKSVIDNHDNPIHYAFQWLLTQSVDLIGSNSGNTYSNNEHLKTIR